MFWEDMDRHFGNIESCQSRLGPCMVECGVTSAHGRGGAGGGVDGCFGG